MFLFSLGQTLLAFAAGIGVTTAMVMTVALVARHSPVLLFWNGLGLAVLAVDFGMLAAIPMIVVGYRN